MGKIIAILIAILIIIVGAIALTHNSNTASSPNNTSPSASQNQPNAPATGTINIVNMLFTPSQITVRKGGTVTWTNNDKTTHTVVDDLSNTGGPNSSEIAPGATYSFTFNKTGSFQYHDRLHSSMRGTIVVK